MRLIDADAVLDMINSQMDMQELYLLIHLKELVIDAQPTAYDVDKVVAELERLRGIERNRPDRCNVDGFGDPEDIYEDGVSQGRFEAYWKAVQIVKGGGVDGE